MSVQWTPIFKRGSRHAAHAANALRWRVDQLLKCPYKENNSLLVMVYFMSRFALDSVLGSN